jgi:GT2 family glycosyltransferase
LEPVKVLIGVPSGDSVVLPFHTSFPLAVKTSWAKLNTYSVRGMNTVSARNKIVHRAIEENFDYVFFMDSDMEFPPNTLDRLLNRSKDIVGGFYTRKKKGFLPNAFRLGFSEGDKLLTEFISDFREVEAIGTGCLLIKTDVFRKIKKPWFYYETTNSPDCHMSTEDIVFCRNAKKAGYKIYCDGEIACGHVGSFIVTPIVVDGVQQIRVEPV